MAREGESRYLIQELAGYCDRPVPRAVTEAANAVAAPFGDSVEAIIAYGSCIRDTDPTDGLLDIYVLVSAYRSAYRRRWLRWANRLLPPNVFYERVSLDQTTVRVKYAVISLRDFDGGLRSGFLPYLWGRFAQPVRLLWSRDETVRQRVLGGLEAAIQRLLGATIPLFEAPVSAERLWERALALSYATELRPEDPGRARLIVDQDVDLYRRLARAVLSGTRSEQSGERDAVYRPPRNGTGRRTAKAAWFARRWLGRPCAVLRLVKASLTFQGGVDYAAWKIERHTGSPVLVTPRLRRHPLIFGWGLLWRLVRQRKLG